LGKPTLPESEIAQGHDRAALAGWKTTTRGSLPKSGAAIFSTNNERTSGNIDVQ
jgi:hypothetical protein